MVAKIASQVLKNVATIFVVGSLASCASGSGQAEPDVDTPPAVESTAEIVLPLDSYQLSRTEYLNLQRAAWQLTGRCVERFGGEYTLPEVAVLTDVPQFEHTNERRFGLYDARSAAEYGYRVPPDQRPPGDGQPFAWNPSEAELLLLQGPSGEGRGTVPMDGTGEPLPDDGCQGDADRALNAGGPAEALVDEHLGGVLSTEAYHRAEVDSRVRDVMERWSDCMSDQGYSYDTIWGPNDFAWPEQVGAEEISTAVADVACKKDVNLVGIWLAVETAYQEELIEENAEELTAIQDLVQAQVLNAAQVVGGS